MILSFTICFYIALGCIEDAIEIYKVHLKYINRCHTCQHFEPSFWVYQCRLLASLASFASRILFMRSTLLVLTSKKPTTFCGHSSWAVHWVVSRRSATTISSLVMLEIGRISWTTSFVRWTSFLIRKFLLFLRRVRSRIVS